nr:hypothetical protein [Hoylesella enoeca]
MEEKKRAANATPIKDTTKITNEKDITKVFEFYRYKTGTTLDCMLETGILRNSITWYVRDLEQMGELRAVCRKKDIHTKRIAKYYSANPDEWKPSRYKQLNLFGKEGNYGI